MPMVEVAGKSIEVDEEGYLTNLADWNKDVADYLAKEEKVDMTDSHWEVVSFLREYYEEYQIAPAVRVLTKAVAKKLGPDKGNNKYLYELFPYGPAKQACKIAGLPKPTGCILSLPGTIAPGGLARRVCSGVLQSRPPGQASLVRFNDLPDIQRIG